MSPLTYIGHVQRTLRLLVGGIFNSRLLLGDSAMYWLLNLILLFGWVTVNCFNHYQTGWMETQLILLILKRVCLYAVILCSLKVIEYFIPAARLLTYSIEIFLKLLILFDISVGISPVLLTTPFPLQDHLLFKIDTLMSINVYDWMNRIVHYPTWIRIFQFCYTYWVDITALLLMYFAIERKDFCHHILRLTQIGILITGCVFYFFPSLGPLSFHSSFWLMAKAHCVLLQSCSEILNKQEYLQIQLHHDLYVGNFFHSGFVSCPSFHFFSGLLIVYFCIRQIKVAVPAAVFFMILLGCATLFLGHHYFSDLIASAVMLVLTLWIEKKLFLSGKNRLRGKGD